MENEEKKFGLVKQEGRNFTYKVHARDKEESFKEADSVEDAVQKYLNMDYGESIIIKATWLNAFCRVTESMASTNYIIVPSLPEMRRWFGRIVNQNSFNYIIVKISNNMNYSIDEIKAN